MDSTARVTFLQGSAGDSWNVRWSISFLILETFYLIPGRIRVLWSNRSHALDSDSNWSDIGLWIKQVKITWLTDFVISLALLPQSNWNVHKISWPGTSGQDLWSEWCKWFQFSAQWEKFPFSDGVSFIDRYICQHHMTIANSCSF